MARLRFNKAVINGTTVVPGDLVPGSGEIAIADALETIVTLDHVIHRVKTGEKGKARFSAFGDKETLATQAIALDTDNFGGTHSFYLDTTLVYSFDGLVDARYNKERRITEITIEGEYNA